ncbi:MAG: 4Fe-4S binding protein [Coriobacteriales bacterium]|jgi:ferredoxin|nr:4Fe-4S binding protein [Coriobacteriales bacterium]
MLRTIIQINEETCDGCGRCASACHEGAIGMVDGKAKLLRVDYCDGLGNCLPACPVGAISFVECDTEAFDEEGARANMMAREQALSGCPSSQPHVIKHEEDCCGEDNTSVCADAGQTSTTNEVEPAHKARTSQLAQWPIQIKLVAANAPFLSGAKLLIAADCCAYAYGDFHERFMKGHITLIGCPKLDDVDYTDKLAQIIEHNDIKSITVAYMEVPCCFGIVHTVKEALLKSGKMVPWRVIKVGADGRIFED